MTYDPQRMMGKADGMITTPDGRAIGMFWENPVTKDMTEAQRKEYWKEYDKNRGTR